MAIDHDGVHCGSASSGQGKLATMANSVGYRHHKISHLLITLMSTIKRGYCVASPPPTGIGDPAICGSQPLTTPVYVDLETCFCFFVCILVKIDSRYGHSIWLCVWFLLVVNTSASDCLERFVPEMIYLCVERDIKLYSLTHSVQEKTAATFFLARRLASSSTMDIAAFNAAPNLCDFSSAAALEADCQSNRSFIKSHQITLPTDRCYLIISAKTRKAQLSLTNPRDACEKFARFT